MTVIANKTSASLQAERNLAANLNLIQHLQPSLIPWITELYLAVEWVFGRDRSLTALDESGHWWAGCSLPRRAAQAMFAKVDVRGAVGCFLAPSHAAQIRTALDLLRPEQAIIAVIPDMRDLAILLRCDDFSRELTANRLWFAAGPAWDMALRRIFEDLRGLATPVQFLRSPDSDKSQIDEMIVTAQQVFAEVGVERAGEMQQIRTRARVVTQKRTGKSRICVAAPGNFRLWNDLGGAMISIFQNAGDMEPIHFNGDNPLQTSPIGLLEAAQDCDALFTANTSRTDLPGLLPENLPWITWVTTPRIPSSALAGDGDHLIVVDPALIEAAVKKGWARQRIHVGTFPPSQTTAASPGHGLGIFADTFPLDTPKDLNDYSSHSLLWESIRHELHRDPFRLIEVNSFLSERARKCEIRDDAFQPQRFIDKLILPAYQQGLARVLLRTGVKPKLFGAGWDRIEEFKGFAHGTLRSREEFVAALSQCSALLHVWPSSLAHPIQAAGLPVVRRTGTGEEFIREAHAAANRRQLIRSDFAVQPLSAALLRSCLH